MTPAPVAVTQESSASTPAAPADPKPGRDYSRLQILFGDRPRTGLYIDTEAAGGLSGDKALLEHEERVLKPLNHPDLKIIKGANVQTTPGSAVTR